MTPIRSLDDAVARAVEFVRRDPIREAAVYLVDEEVFVRYCNEPPIAEAPVKTYAIAQAWNGKQIQIRRTGADSTWVEL